MEFFAPERKAWSFIAAVPGAEVNNARPTGHAALAVHETRVNSSAGLFSIWASDWRPRDAAWAA